jgi:hypothetical protein
MDLGVLEKKKLELLMMPLSEQEEAILQLLKRINHLEHENFVLKEENRQLRWTLSEQD